MHSTKSSAEGNKLRKKDWVKCCIVNQFTNKSSKKVHHCCTAWYSGNWGKSSAQPTASTVCVYDNTFPMSILQNFLSRGSCLSQFWLSSLGWALMPHHVPEVSLCCSGSTQPCVPQRMGICLLCFSSFTAIMIPCLSFQPLIELENYSHSTGGGGKKKNLGYSAWLKRLFSFTAQCSWDTWLTRLEQGYIELTRCSALPGGSASLCTQQGAQGVWLGQLCVGRAINR